MGAVWTSFVFPHLIGYGADLHVPAATLGGIVVAALVLTAGAAAVPALRAARLPIREALAAV
jgi:ABC-type lipoprotein release transport system permease subunit